ncbi:MAG: hypothetical protein ACI9GZ_001237 [Bacteroidia bacterium]|jgi:hypothetical protein
MRLIYITFIIFFSTQAQAQQAKVWKTIFNGQNLDGWSIIGGAGKVSIEGGAIKLGQKANTAEHTFIHTNRKYKDFILEVDCKRDVGFFYGILFRAQPAPDTAHVRLYGYQSKVDHNSKRNWTGGIFDDFGNTWNWMYTPVNDQRAQKVLKPAGEWDHYRIEAIGHNIKVWLNGIPISNILNSKYDQGYIALKIHFLGDKKEKEKNASWIKNIKVIDTDVLKYAQQMDISTVTVK